jgi:hypothetical protein
LLCCMYQVHKPILKLWPLYNDGDKSINERVFCKMSVNCDLEIGDPLGCTRRAGAVSIFVCYFIDSIW